MLVARAECHNESATWTQWLPDTLPNADQVACSDTLFAVEGGGSLYVFAVWWSVGVIAGARALPRAARE